MVDINLSTVSKILGYQLLTVLLVTAGYAIAGGMPKAISSAAGGVAAFIPNLYFALRMYKAKAQEPRKIVRSFYVGESGKLILTAVLFVLIFQIPNLQIVPLLVEYVAVLSIFWFALLIR